MRFPKIGDPVTVADYGNTPYLFHWTPLEGLDGICRHRHIVCGTGQNWPELAAQGLCSQLYWSTQMDRWGVVVPFAKVLLRAPVKYVQAAYDGTLWEYTGDADPDWEIEGRLSDAVSMEPVSIDLLEGMLVDDPGDWTEKVDEWTRHMGIPPSSDAMGNWIPLEELCCQLGIN